MRSFASLISCKAEEVSPSGIGSPSEKQLLCALGLRVLGNGVWEKKRVA